MERHTQKTHWKNEKESRKFNGNKTSLQAKRVCEDLERIAIDEKQKNRKYFINNQVDQIVSWAVPQ